jgi:hypothetical protein
MVLKVQVVTKAQREKLVIKVVLETPVKRALRGRRATKAVTA